MIKAIYFFHKKRDLSVEDFQRYWRMIHADLVRQIPGVRCYVQCHTLMAGYHRPTLPPLDGVEEIGFDSLADLAAAEKMPGGRAAFADLAHFVDLHRLRHIVTQEIVIKPGEIRDTMVKNIELVNRKASMILEDFHRYWQEFHGPLAAKIEMIKRYVQSHTLMSEYKKDKQPAYDGVAETWFDDTAAMRHSATTPEYTATRADEKNFLAGELPFIITHEVRII
jgi:uncharacterized protein (TIGR02118 family)